MRLLLPILLPLLLLSGCSATLTPASRADGHAVIAMITDYGTRDEYVGILRGAILSIDPDARMADITHEVPPFDIAEGEYTLSLAAPEFPEGTVFLGVVDPGVGSARRSVAIQTKNGMWFVGPDNGLFTGPIEKWGVAQFFEITKPPTGRPRSDTFHGRELFAPAAALLASGRDPADFAEKVDGDPVLLKRLVPSLEAGVVSGQIVHVDYYGNLITNIPDSLVAEAGIAFGKRVTVSVGANGRAMPYEKTYSSVVEGSFVAVDNSRHMFEVAINMGSAGAALAAHAGDEIRVALASQ